MISSKKSEDENLDCEEEDNEEKNDCLGKKKFLSKQKGYDNRPALDKSYSLPVHALEEDVEEIK